MESLPAWELSSSSRSEQADRGLQEGCLQEKAKLMYYLIHLYKMYKKGDTNMVLYVAQQRMIFK